MSVLNFLIKILIDLSVDLWKFKGYFIWRWNLCLEMYVVMKLIWNFVKLWGWLWIWWFWWILVKLFKVKLIWWKWRFWWFFVSYGFYSFVEDYVNYLCVGEFEDFGEFEEIV